MSVPQIRQILDIYGLAAQKKLSQNFILNNGILASIARLIKPTGRTLIVEIGPGPGSLTRHLLNLQPAKLITFELDRRFEPALEVAAGTDTLYLPV